MKIKSNYVLKTMKDMHIVVPLEEEALRFNGIITLNKTGKFYFELLQEAEYEENTLLEKMLERFDVTKERAREDLKQFLDTCRSHNLFI